MSILRRIPLAAMALAFALLPIASISLAQKTNAVPTASASNVELVDINTATRDQLKTLPGVGDAYADRIIKGRPYTAKNQLTQRGVLPTTTYSKIQTMIIARRTAK